MESRVFTMFLGATLVLCLIQATTSAPSTDTPSYDQDWNTWNATNDSVVGGTTGSPSDDDDRYDVNDFVTGNPDDQFQTQAPEELEVAEEPEVTEEPEVAEAKKKKKSRGSKRLGRKNRRHGKKNMRRNRRN